jgi:hypothetical protein
MTTFDRRMNAFGSWFLAVAPTLGGLITPRAIDRFRPILILMEFGFLLIGCAFWISTQSGVDSFSPETWGVWACILPAELWAAVQMVSGVMIVTGLLHPVTRHRIVFGCILQIVQLLGLSVSAMFSGGQFVIAIYPLVLFVPFHVILAAEATVYESGGA